MKGASFTVFFLGSGVVGPIQPAARRPERVFEVQFNEFRRDDVVQLH